MARINPTINNGQFSAQNGVSSRDIPKTNGGIQQDKRSPIVKLKEKAATSKAQRPLRKLEHNELLLQKKFVVSDLQTERKAHATSIGPPEEPENISIRLGFRERSKALHTAYQALCSDTEEDQDNEDFDADLQFWMTSKPKQLQPPRRLENSFKSPRAQRAKDRTKKKPTETAIIARLSHEQSTKVTAKSCEEAKTVALPDSRPTSSYGGDPCALLSFEPIKKFSPVKATQVSRPSTPTRPSTPPKLCLRSPTKLHTIPKSPFNHALDDFWAQDVVNDWNDQYSPQKSLKSPRKKNILQAKSEDSDGYISPCVSPRKSPAKKDKVAKDARKAFEERKHSIASDFFCRLDKEITQGKLSELAKDTGGVQLIWSKKLNSTAGRANWKREGTVTKHSDGSVDKVYKHYASIELAEKVIDEEARLYNTLAHEFCHLANFMVSGIKDNPHGKEFKAWGRKCTATFKDLGVEVTTKHSYDIDYKYIWECIECGTEYKRHSKSIDITKHRCGRCKAKLTQTKPAPRTVKTSEYQVFIKEHFQKLRKKHPKESHGFIMKLIGELYRSHKTKSSVITEGSVEELIDGLGAVTLDV